MCTIIWSTIGLWIFRQCDTIVTISQSHRAFIKKFTTKEPIIIYNPIDYIPKARTKNTIPHIGFIWRLVSLKGVDILIKALKQIENNKWTCTIVWEGNQEDNLKNLVQSLWLDDRIHFFWADDRVNRLHRFDIFVNPSYQEWLPTTVVEALISGCVVVATDVGGTREILNSKDLILVKKWNGESLSCWINDALLNYKHYDSKSCNVVKENFNVDKNIKRYFSLYRNI